MLKVAKLIILFLYQVVSQFPQPLELYEGDACNLDLQTHGICKSIYDCHIAVEYHKIFGIKPITCSFNGFIPIVCCPVDNNNHNTGTGSIVTENKDAILELPNNNEKQRISQIECGSLNRNCGGSMFVVGGIDAKLGEFPHMALIGWSQINSNNIAWNCGGSLISLHYILTAAHCTWSSDSTLKSENPTVVRLGEHNLGEEYYNENVQNIPIESIILHPEYIPPNKYNDIALIKLRYPARLNPFVNTICLWDKFDIPPLVFDIKAAGWGKTTHFGDKAEILQKANLQIINNQYCNDSYKITRALRRGIVKEQLCASDPNGIMDTCQGDSGGPLQISYNCNTFVIGVTSFGTGCGGTAPGVYTRVSSYIDWLENIVWKQ